MTTTLPVQIIPSLQERLRQAVDGEVRFDLGSRAAYSVDSSNYREVPVAVVAPRSVDDAVAAIAVCASEGAPVVSRGGGTSLGGQTTNSAVVVDWTKYCHHLVSLDVEARTCVVEPGMALDELNRQLAPHGLMYGPKPATHRSCTLGGMIGNNSCGSTAQAYGKTVDNIVRLEVLTYDGLRMWVGPTSDDEYAQILDEGGRRAGIYRELRRLRDENLSLIRTRYPAIPRRVSGYNLDSLLPENHFDLARALVGSEGTLVTVLHAELRLVGIPKAKAMVVLGYPDIAAAGDAVMEIVAHDPWQLEGMDQVLIDMEKQARLAGTAIDMLPRGGGWLIVQFAGDDQDDADARAKKLLDDIEKGDHPPTDKFLDDPAKEDELVEARESGLGPPLTRSTSTTPGPGGRTRPSPRSGWVTTCATCGRCSTSSATTRTRPRSTGTSGRRASIPGSPSSCAPSTGSHTSASSPPERPTSSRPTGGRCPGSTGTGRRAETCCPGCSATRSSLCSAGSRRSSTPVTG